MLKTKPKVVVDTNLWLSFLINGSLKEIFDFFEKNKVSFFITNELVSEIIDTGLKAKFRKYFEVDDLLMLINILTEKGQFIIPISVVKICRDKSDDFLLGISKDANADFLLTGDKDLLELKQFEKTQIITYQQFF